MECGSSLRVESNGVGYIYAFNEGVDNFRSELLKIIVMNQGKIV